MALVLMNRASDNKKPAMLNVTGFFYFYLLSRPEIAIHKKHRYGRKRKLFLRLYQEHIFVFSFDLSSYIIISFEFDIIFNK